MRRLALESVGLAAAITCAVTVVTFTPAHADDATDLAALQNVTANADSQATAVLDSVANLTPDVDDSTAIGGTAGGGTVSVPTDPSNQLAVSLPGSSAGMTR